MKNEKNSDIVTPQRKFTVGLTGGIGSGKTTISQLFAELGATIIDTDVIARSLTQPNTAASEQIKAVFGAEYIEKNGAMNRNAMRKLVFKNKEAKTKLEGILHPLIFKEAQRQADLVTEGYPIFVVPLLTESSRWKNQTTRILVVDCTEEDQIARVMQRNQLSRQEVEAIMASQATRADRLSIANDVIHNQSNLIELEPQVERLHALYSTLADTKNSLHL